MLPQNRFFLFSLWIPTYSNTYYVFNFCVHKMSALEIYCLEISQHMDTKILPQNWFFPFLFGSPYLTPNTSHESGSHCQSTLGYMFISIKTVFAELRFK